MNATSNLSPGPTLADRQRFEQDGFVAADTVDDGAVQGIVDRTLRFLEQKQMVERR